MGFPTFVLPPRSDSPKAKFKKQNQPKQRVCRTEVRGSRRLKTSRVGTGEDPLWSGDNSTFTIMLARRWTGHDSVGVRAAQRMLGGLGQVYYGPTAPKGPACLSPTPSLTAVMASSHLPGACSHAFYHSDAETHVDPAQE